MKNKKLVAAWLRPSVLIVFAVTLMVGLSGRTFGQGSFTVEYDVDRMGSDIRSFDLPEAKYELCYNACLQEKRCKAYTYVKPGVQGSSARCWLKNSKPRKIANQSCCISGASRVKSMWVGGWWAYSFGNVYLEQDEEDQLSGKYSDGGKIWGSEGDDGKFYFRFQNNDGTAQGQGVWFLTDAAKGTFWGQKCYGFGCTPEGGYGVARK